MAGPTVIDEFHRHLRAELEHDREQLVQTLANNLATDIEHYRYMCGTIVALNQVLDKCSEIEARMYSGGRSKDDENNE